MECYVPVFTIKVLACKKPTSGPPKKSDDNQRRLKYGKELDNVIVCCETKPDPLFDINLTDKEKLENIRKYILYSQSNIFKALRRCIVNTFNGVCLLEADPESLALDAAKIQVVSLAYEKKSDCTLCESINSNPELKRRSNIFCSATFDDPPAPPPGGPGPGPDLIPETPPGAFTNPTPEDLPEGEGDGEGPAFPEMTDPPQPPDEDAPRPQEAVYTLSIPYVDPCKLDPFGGPAQKTININILSTASLDIGEEVENDGVPDDDAIAEDEIKTKIIETLTENKDKIKISFDTTDIVQPASPIPPPPHKDTYSTEIPMIKELKYFFNQPVVAQADFLDKHKKTTAQNPMSIPIQDKIDIVRNVIVASLKNKRSSQKRSDPTWRIMKPLDPDIPYNFTVTLPGNKDFYLYEATDADAGVDLGTKGLLYYLFAESFDLNIKISIEVTIKKIIESATLNVEPSCSIDPTVDDDKCNETNLRDGNGKYKNKIPNAASKMRIPAGDNNHFNFNGIDIFIKDKIEGTIAETTYIVQTTIPLTYYLDSDSLNRTTGIFPIPPEYPPQPNPISWYSDIQGLYELKIKEADKKVPISINDKNINRLKIYILNKFISKLSKEGKEAFGFAAKRAVVQNIVLPEEVKTDLAELFGSAITPKDSTPCCCCSWIPSFKDELQQDSPTPLVNVKEGYSFDLSQFNELEIKLSINLPAPEKPPEQQP